MSDEIDAGSEPATPEGRGAPPDDEEERPKPPPAGFAVVAWGLTIFAGCRALELFLEAQATASAVGQAVLVEWGTSRLGIVWSDPKAPSSPMQIAKRTLTGTGIGFTIAMIVVAVLRVSGAATTEGVPNLATSVIVVGLITAALHAWRDELLLHGVVLRATSNASDLLRILACAVTSAGAALGRSGASERDIAVAALLGVVFGALWIRDRGAWQAVGAQTALRFATDTLVAGGVIQLRLGADRWAGGDAGALGGFAAVAALVPVAIVAIVMTLRRISPDPAPVG